MKSPLALSVLVVLFALAPACAQVARKAGAPPVVVTAVGIGEQVVCGAAPPRMMLWEEALLEAGKRVLRAHCEGRSIQNTPPLSFAQMEDEALDAIACDATIGEAYGDPDDPFIAAWFSVCRG